MINRIYLAGPYTGDGSWEDRTENTERAIDEFHKLLDKDLNPYIPHLFHYAEARQERDYKEWLDLDIRWLEQCDSLVRLGGESPGSDQEVEYCRDNNIPYFLGMDELNDYLENIGQIYVLMGPSGVGKTTLVENTIKDGHDKFQDRYEVVVSCTSREPREGEVGGEEYIFLSDEEMDEIAANDGFVEHVEYRGNQYGFRKEDFNEPLEKGKSVVVVANEEGFFNLRDYYDDRPVHGLVTLPFGAFQSENEEQYLSDCKEVLVSRMEKRGDSQQQIANRLEGVEEEIKSLYELALIGTNCDAIFNNLPEGANSSALYSRIGPREHDHHQRVYEEIRANSDG